MSKNEPCPKCGHCPTCGRDNNGLRPMYVRPAPWLTPYYVGDFPPVQWWTDPYWVNVPFGTTTTTTTNSTNLP